MPNKNRRLITAGIIVALLVLITDQASKWLILEITKEPKTIHVLPFFNLTLLWNKGVSFGMFAAHDQPIILSTIALGICVILSIWLIKSDNLYVACALGAAIGGALGNVIDRFRFGAVVDFLDFYVGRYHWPAFNIADSAIFIGVVVLCIHSMFIEHRKPD